MQDCGFNLVKTIDFPDHHFYQEAELQAIIKDATAAKAEIYTTSKDYIKIPAHLRTHFKVLEIEISWSEPESLKEFILSRLK